MKERDQRDSTRADAPLSQAPDAIYLDSTRLTIDEVEEAILKIVRQRVTNGKDFQLNDLLVMKFGGTSVGSAERMQVSARLGGAGSARRRPVAIVVSAMSKITDLLLDTMRHAEGGDRAGIETEPGARCAERHEEACRELLPEARQAAVLAQHRRADRRIRAHRARHGDAGRAAAAIGG